MESGGVMLAQQLLHGVGGFRHRGHGLHLRQHFSITVGRRRRGVNYAANAGLRSRKIDVERAVGIHIVRGNRVIDGLRHRRDRRQMKYRIRAGDHPPHSIEVADIGVMEIDARTHFGQVLLSSTQKIIDDGDVFRTGI